jgi:hypothetical protein
MDSMQLWSEVYAPRWAAIREREVALREQAFIDWESVVLGERIRQITLGDIHMLHGAGSPFVVGGEIQAKHVIQFMWILHAENKGGAFRRGWNLGRMKARLLKIKSADPLRTCCKAINAYLDDVFQDSPTAGNGESRPIGAGYIAIVLVRLGMKLGTFDPATGKPWADTPLARIFQYFKAINSYEMGKDFKDFSPSDKVMSDWLAHSNRLSASAN